MAYSEKVNDHYDNPRNVGSFGTSAEVKERKDVGVGIVGAPECGDVMQLQIKVGDDGVIEDAKFKCFGCGSAIASSSLATEWIKGKSVDDALKIRRGLDPHRDQRLQAEERACGRGRPRPRSLTSFHHRPSAMARAHPEPAPTGVRACPSM